MSTLCYHNNKINKTISTNVQQLLESKIPNTLSHEENTLKEDNTIILRMALPKIQKVINVIGDIEGRQFKYLFSRNINYYSHHENALIN